jgi:hypothetical protein
VWDHWVPGANNTLTRPCNTWEKNKVDASIDHNPDGLLHCRPDRYIAGLTAGATKG